jgi:hypothetical protein
LPPRLSGQGAQDAGNDRYELPRGSLEPMPCAGPAA